ncbi:FCRL5 protein, partial [Polyodon spathula]|nr:FCRL5 protein [Polyodon spathula]
MGREDFYDLCAALQPKICHCRLNRAISSSPPPLLQLSQSPSQEIHCAKAPALRPAALPPELPKAVLTSSPQWGELYTGETVTLSCVVQGGFTGLQYLWYKSSQGGRVNIRDTAGARYTLSPVTQSHSGEYQCEAQRGDRPPSSQRSDPVTLTVSEGQPKPALTRETAGEIFEGDTVTLSCVIQGGSGGWRYLWYKDRQGAPVYQTDSSSGAGAGYTISAAALSHSGEYWCRAGRGSNTFYSQYSDPIWVNVTVKMLPLGAQDESHSLDGTSSCPGCAKRLTFAGDLEGGTRLADAPRVTLTASPGATVKEGEALNLTCEAAVNKTPRPELHYSIVRDREPVTTSSDSALYSIASTEKSHAGSYTCAVESQGVKKSSQELYIEVQRKPGIGIRIRSSQKWGLSSPAVCSTLEWNWNSAAC